MLAIYISLQTKNVELDKLDQKNRTVAAEQQTLQKSALGSSSSVLNVKHPKEQILKLKSTTEIKQAQEESYQSTHRQMEQKTAALEQQNNSRLLHFRIQRMDCRKPLK